MQNYPQSRQHHFNELSDLIFHQLTDPYTKMIEMLTISIPSEKVRLRKGEFLVIKDGKIAYNSKEVPTHAIIKLEGTTADTKHQVTVQNLIDNEIQIVTL